MTTLEQLGRLETIRAELSYCYEDLGPLMTYRGRIAEAIEHTNVLIDDLTPARCQGTRHADWTPCPSDAVLGEGYCQRHLGGQKGAAKRLSTRRMG